MPIIKDGDIIVSFDQIRSTFRALKLYHEYNEDTEDTEKLLVATIRD